MNPVGLLALFAIVVFFGLLAIKIETWRPRIILSLIAATVFLFFGLIGAMIACSLLSVGIILSSMMPKISKL